MKKSKQKTNLSINDLKIESFSTSLEQKNKQVHTGMPWSVLCESALRCGSIIRLCPDER